MAILVLDASVVIKWFKQEIYTDIATKIKDDFVNGIYEIVVPDLILYEITNALRYDKRFDDKFIKESLDNLLKMEINIVIPSQRLISRSIELSYSSNVTIYDATYIALAELNGAIFVTADETLYKKSKRMKLVKFISKNKKK